MSSRIKVWEINRSDLTETKESALADFHSEAELETWIVKEPRLLGENLLIIGKQWDIAGVGRLDLLAIDAAGKLVIVELKRDVATREAIAQALDYASWLHSASEEEIKAHAKAFLKEDLEDAYQSRFGSQLVLSCGNHRIVVVAARPDDAAQRIIEYLADKHKIEINGVFFTFWKLGAGPEIVVRSVLVPETPAETTVVSPPRLDTADLLNRATERGVNNLLAVFRQSRLLSTDGGCTEQPAATSGGSFRYWKETPEVGARVLYGVNISGQLASAAQGELTVWVRAEAIAEITGQPEDSVRARFIPFQPETSGRMDFVMRVRSIDEAKRIVQELESVVCGSRATQTGTA